MTATTAVARRRLNMFATPMRRASRNADTIQRSGEVAKWKILR
jgi:hypothetical protein